MPVSAMMPRSIQRSQRATAGMSRSAEAAEQLENAVLAAC